MLICHCHQARTRTCCCVRVAASARTCARRDLPHDQLTMMQMIAAAAHEHSSALCARRSMCVQTRCGSQRPLRMIPVPPPRSQCGATAIKHASALLLVCAPAPAAQTPSRMMAQPAAAAASGRTASVACACVVARRTLPIHTRHCHQTCKRTAPRVRADASARARASRTCSSDAVSRDGAASSRRHARPRSVCHLHVRCRKAHIAISNTPWPRARSRAQHQNTRRVQGPKPQHAKAYTALSCGG